MKVLTKIGAVAVLLCSGAALAQPTITISSENVAPSANATVSIDYVGDGTQLGVTFTLLYDINLTVVDTSDCVSGASGFASCNDLGDTNMDNLGEIAFAIANAVPQPSATWGTIVFGAPAAPGMYPVSVDPATVNYSPGGNIGNEVDGGVTVAAGPGPGVMDVSPDPVALVNAVNGPASTGDLTISNQGAPMDNDLSANCALNIMTADPGVTLTVPPFMGTLSVGGPDGVVTASCSGTAAGTATGSYDCDGGAAGMDSSAVSCTVSAGMAVPNPAADSTVGLIIGPVARGQSGSRTQTFSEVGNSGGTYDVSCNITNTGGGAFTLVGSGMASVPSGGSAGVTVAGQSSFMDPQPTGTMVCDYSNGAMGQVTVLLSITLIPEIVPTLSQWGLILLVLSLVGFGAFSLRSRTNAA